MKVCQKVIDNGLIDESVEFSKEEIEVLIFMLGFFMVFEIFDVFGCGVGMDVVCCNIQKFGGCVIVEFDEGKGLIFILVLLLILVVLDGMLILVVGECFVVFLFMIVEIVCLDLSVIC